MYIFFLLLHLTYASCPIDTSSNLAQNGDFELPVVSGYDDELDNIPGWIVTPVGEIGDGTIYNYRWATGQIIETDVSSEARSENYTKIETLNAGYYLVSFQYACRTSANINHCSVQIYWNDQLKFTASPPDYELYTKTFLFQAQEGDNSFSIVDSVNDPNPTTGGMGIDNVEFYEIQGNNWEIINTTYGENCQCQTGYIFDGTIFACRPCNQISSGCNNCEYDAQYSVFNFSAFQCTDCPDGYYFGGVHCQICGNSIPYCTNCSLDGNICYECIDNHFPDTPSSSVKMSCPECPLDYCITCQLLTRCSLCDQNSSYFLNTTTGLCQQCPLQHCLHCVSFTQCQICNEAAEYFLNSTSLLCQSCTLQQCLDCASFDECLTCKETVDYFLNTTSKLCQPCSLIQCLDCASLTECLVCNQVADYFLNTSTNVCDPCDLNQCLDCASSTECLLCNQIEDYFLNVSTNVCEACSLQECLNCASLTECLTCNQTADYFLNTTIDICQPCNLNQCLDCASFSQCVVCNQTGDFFLSSETSLCQPCQLNQCLDCDSPTVCLECNQTVDYFLDNSTNLCKLCDLIQCLDCSSLTECFVCNQTSDYFFNTSNNQCEPCTLSNCLDCINFEECLLCDFNNSFYLTNSSQCDFCNNSQNDFINTSNLQCESCDLFQCVICESLSTCSQCNNSAHYFLNDSTSLCDLCLVQGCLTCSSLTTCSQCDPEYGLENSICLLCNESCICNGYVQPWNGFNCSSLCGDGWIVLEEECDDNSSVSDDGCSSDCKVEEHFECTEEPSVCQFVGVIAYDQLIAERDGCNNLTIKFIIQPAIPLLHQANLTNLVSIHQPNISLTSISYSTGWFIIRASYSGDITAEQFHLIFDPSPFYFLNSSNLSLYQVSYSPIIPPAFYTDVECTITDSTRAYLSTVQIISYVILAGSVFTSSKVIGLQLFGVMQLAYFDLMTQDFLNFYYSTLAEFNSFNGIKQQPVRSSQSASNDILEKMQMSTFFYGNFNIMFYIIIGFFFISLITFFVSKFFRIRLLKKMAIFLFYQIFLSLILFTTFDIAFSAGIHWKYADSSSDQYIASSFVLFSSLLLLVVTIFLLECANPKYFGEFKKMFKRDRVSKLYIPLTILYRVAVGFYIGMTRDNPVTVLVLAFALSFLMYNLINLPYRNPLHNYRANILHFSQFLIIIIFNYEKSLTNAPLEEKSHRYGPAFLLMFCLGISLIVSLFFFIYEVYRLIVKVKQYFQKRSVANIDHSNETLKVIKPKEQNQAEVEYY